MGKLTGTGFTDNDGITVGHVTSNPVIWHSIPADGPPCTCRTLCRLPGMLPGASGRREC